MDQIWELIAPYVAAIGGATGFGAIVWGFVVLVAKRFTQKWGEFLDTKYSVNQMATAVADKLAGKTLNIDVTAVTEKALKKTAAALGEQVQRVEETGEWLKMILVPMAKAMARFKALTDDEKGELAIAIQRLTGNMKTPADDEVMTVMLQPLSVESVSEQTDVDVGAAGGDGVNFGDLEG